MSLAEFRDPEVVTVLGASQDPAKWGHWIARGALLGQHRRKVHLINARGGVIDGHHCVSSIADIQGDLGLVVICLPPVAARDAVGEALARGARSFLCITAAMDVALGEGGEAALVDQIRRAGGRIVGPNCLGIFDAESDLQLAWGTFLPGRLGIVSQSGQLGSEIADLAALRGLGVSRFVSIGNQSDVSASEVLADMVDHDQTAAVALYLESFDDAAALMASMRRLRDAGKPVLVLTVGASAASQQAAATHTGSLTSDIAVVEAACRAAGGLLVHTPTELVDVARLAVSAPRLRGRRVAVVGDSGGQGALAVDVLASAGLETPALPDAVQQALRAALPAGAAVGNPIDLAGAGEGDLETYARVMHAAAEADNIDAVILTGYFGSYGQHVPALQPAEEATALHIADIAQCVDKPVLVHAMSPTSATLDLLGARVPTHHGIEEAARALAGTARLNESRIARPRAEVAAIEGGLPVGYLAARTALQEVGVRFPRARAVRTIDDLHAAASELRAPYVLKADWIAHKTEQGAVAVGLDIGAAASAFVDMSQRLGDGTYVLEEMDRRNHVVEMIVGARRDPAFGVVVMVGLGGVQAELWRDTRIELGPVDREVALSMVQSLRCRPLLEGWRGAPAADVEALVDTMVAVSRYLAEGPRQCTEVELNPVRVGPQGAIAVDALVLGGTS